MAFSSGGIFLPVHGQLPELFFQIPRPVLEGALCCQPLESRGCIVLRSVSELRHARAEGPEIRRILHDIGHGFRIEPKERTEPLIAKVFTTIVQKLGNGGNLGTISAGLRANQVRQAVNEIEPRLGARQCVEVVERVQ